MKIIIGFFGVLIALVAGAWVLAGASLDTNAAPQPGDTVSMVDGTQIITIKAKGGYQPRQSIAQAGVPTVLRFNTQGTFDCSAAVRIPRLNISRTLPASGSTDIALGEQPSGTLKGTCGMGMYPFEVVFRS